jgi:hypothetical protein
MLIDNVTKEGLKHYIPVDVAKSTTNDTSFEKLQ